MTSIRNDTPWTTIAERSESQTILSTLHAIKEGSGMACIGMIEGQLQGIATPLPSLGDALAAAPLADRLQPQGPEGALNETQLALRLAHDQLALYHGDNAPLRNSTGSVVELWCITTDAGSDIAFARRAIQIETEHVVTKILLDMDCLCHQYQLLSFDTLSDVDEILLAVGRVEDDDAAADAGENEAPPWKYFSVLSKSLHLWRDRARSFFDVAKDMPQLGPEGAMRVCGKVILTGQRIASDAAK